MKLFTFGDSWTEGQGADILTESKLVGEEKRLFRNSLSWPKHLGNLLNIESINLGRSASSNKLIFDTIVDTIKSNSITSNDIVIVMWSSSLRDNVPFFPNGEWHTWGNRYVEKRHWFDWIVNNTNFSKNSNYNHFLKKYKLFFMENVYDEYYYNIVNQNYILFLQELFKEFGIRYVFCDAFDNMLNFNIPIILDKINLIDTSFYWGFGKKTIKDHLREIDKTDKLLWESEHSWDITAGKHPNSDGYKCIANELYNYIIDTNRLQSKSNKNINLI
jgi:lysophospholipase L1-like esterase